MIKDKKLLHEILDETIEYYTGKTRYAMYYNRSNKQCCAVGRYLNKPNEFINKIAGYHDDKIVELFNYDNEQPEFFGHHPFFGTNISENFKQKYQQIDSFFWSQIQELHDNDINWLNDELSFMGNNKVNMIKSSINA